MKREISSASTIATLLLLLGSTPALAYLDPVTGSFLIQGIIGLVAAILVGVRKVRQRVLELLGFRRKDEEVKNSER